MTASPFLANAKLISREDSSLSVYQSLELEPNTKIATPEYITNTKHYRTECAPTPRWNRALALNNDAFDVSYVLAKESLAKIHPQYEDTLEGQNCISLFNVIAFGAFFIDDLPSIQANNVTYGQLCRAAKFMCIEHEQLDQLLRSMLDAKVVSVRHYAPQGMFTLRAFPFLSYAKMVSQEERLDNIKRLLREGSARANKRRRDQVSHSEKIDQIEERVEKAQREKEQRRQEIGNVDLGPESHCVGRAGIECTYGEDGKPRVVSANNWFLYFGICQRRPDRPPQRITACDKCCNASRKRFYINYQNAYAKHTNLSFPPLGIRKVIDDMIKSGCALCGQEFDMTVGSDDGLHWRPWKASVNGIDPCSDTVFETVSEFKDGVNLVHVACNYAQHRHSFEEAQQVSQYIVDHLSDVKTGERLKLGEDEMNLLTKAGCGHGLSREDIAYIVANTLRTRCAFTGMTIGYGRENDVDLTNLFHPLLSLSLDRIDCRIEKDSPDNYRIILRIFNWVTNAFDDKPGVITKWLENIGKKFGKTDQSQPVWLDIETADKDLCNHDDESEEKSDEKTPIAKRKKYSYKFECDQCDYSIQSLQGLQTHMQAEHGVKRAFPCPLPNCDQAFMSKAVLQQHLSTFKHTAPGRYGCLHASCNTRFNCRSDRDLHYQQKHQ